MAAQVTLGVPYTREQVTGAARSRSAQAQADRGRDRAAGRAGRARGDGAGRAGRRTSSAWEPTSRSRPRRPRPRRAGRGPGDEARRRDERDALQPVRPGRPARSRSLGFLTVVVTVCLAPQPRAVPRGRASAARRRPAASGTREAAHERSATDLLEHDYDGIKEYDNPLPSWWSWIFVATIVFSLGYWGYYQIGPGPSLARGVRAGDERAGRASGQAGPRSRRRGRARSPCAR